MAEASDERESSQRSLIDPPIGPDAQVHVQIITPTATAATSKDKPASNENDAETSSAEAASSPYLGKYKFVHVRFMDEVRRQKRFTVSAKDIVGFTDDADTVEPYLLAQNTIVDGKHVEGFVQIIAKLESMTDFNNNKRLPVRKINDSVVQDAKEACKLIDTKKIKQEKLSAQKRKRTVKTKLPKQPKPQPPSTEAAKKAINLQLLSVVTNAMGKDGILEDGNQAVISVGDKRMADADKSSGGNGVAESGVQNAVNVNQVDQDVIKLGQSQSKAIPAVENDTPPNESMEKRMEALEERNRMLMEELVALRSVVATSTPRSLVHSVRGTPGSQVSTAKRATAARRSLGFGESPIAAAPSPKSPLAFPMDKSPGVAASLAPPRSVSSAARKNKKPAKAASQPTKSKSSKKRPSIQAGTVRKRRRSARDPAKLFIPKDCHPKKYETPDDRPFQSVYIKKLQDGTQVPMVHLYYGEELPKEDWLTIRCSATSVMDFVIMLGRSTYGIEFRDKAVLLKRAKPRLKNQVRKAFTPKKKPACGWFIRLRYKDVKADYQNFFNDHLRRAINNEIIIALRKERQAEGLPVDEIDLELMKELDVTIDEEVTSAANQGQGEYELPDEVDLLQNEAQKSNEQGKEGEESDGDED